MSVDSSDVELAVGDNKLKAKENDVEKLSFKNEETDRPCQVDGNQYVDVTSDKDGGVLKYVQIEGSGSFCPVNGDLVCIRYVGKLANGEVLETSGDETFEFTVGKGSHIKAWDVGIKTMRRGELAVFKVHSDYAYGENGSPPDIPPNASLIFEVELISWQGDDVSDEGDGSILKSQLVEGEGFGGPNDGATCEIHIIGRCNDAVFEDRIVSFQLGEGSEFGIVEGVEIALKRFTRGEKSRLKVRSDLAYGQEGCPKLSIPPNCDLDFEVDLRSFVRVKEFFDMNLEEKLQESVIAKERGTNYFKAGKIKLALMLYQKVVEYLQFEDTLEGSSKETRDKLLFAAYLNVAACLVKLDYNLREAVEVCDRALMLDPNSEKSYYRRGQANHTMQNYEEAIQDFNSVLNINPDNRTARFQLSISERMLWDMRQKEKKTYYGMFEKLAGKPMTTVTGYSSTTEPHHDNSTDINDAGGDNIAENIAKDKQGSAAISQPSTALSDI